MPDHVNPAASVEDAKAEYLEAGQYIRHYSNLKFAILTIYFAVVGALAAVASGVASSQAHTHLINCKVLDWPRCAALGAAAVTGLFFNYERVLNRYQDHFVLHQQSLERDYIMLL
jgi:hypothetical protein